MEANNLNRFNSINDVVNVLFVIGYIIDFCFRKEIFNEELKIVSLIPFIINIALIAYLSIVIFRIKQGNNKFYKEKIGTIFKFILNIVFIFLIVYI
ncbi:MAG TPA: hypothetical protein VK050_02650 [Flavobacteriaceae bacterium]|nr:hypothetical protein [Flavobacteriaceae bacterium]